MTTCETPEWELGDVDELALVPLVFALPVLVTTADVAVAVVDEAPAVDKDPRDTEPLMPKQLAKSINKSVALTPPAN